MTQFANWHWRNQLPRATACFRVEELSVGCGTACYTASIPIALAHDPSWDQQLQVQQQTLNLAAGLVQSSGNV